jgi:hypothetical protein
LFCSTFFCCLSIPYLQFIQPQSLNQCSWVVILMRKWHLIFFFLSLDVQPLTSIPSVLDYDCIGHKRRLVWWGKHYLINQASYFQTWVFAMIPVTCIVIQLVYLNKVHTFLICKSTYIKGNLSHNIFLKKRICLITALSFLKWHFS